MSGSSTDLLKILWVVLAVVLATGEIAVPGFFLLPFGLGAAAAAVAAFVGAGVVIDAVGPDDPGLVRIDREEWRASPASGQRFEVGDHVVVTDVEGTRVIVVASTAEEVSP